MVVSLFSDGNALVMDRKSQNVKHERFFIEIFPRLGMSSVLSGARVRADSVARRADDEARQELREIERDVERYMDPIDEHFMELVDQINAVEIFFARRKVNDDVK